MGCALGKEAEFAMIRFALIAYAIVAMMTWGFVAADPCPVPIGQLNPPKCGSVPDAWLVGIFGGALWPVYWSKEAFTLVRK